MAERYARVQLRYAAAALLRLLPRRVVMFVVAVCRHPVLVCRGCCWHHPKHSQLPVVGTPWQVSVHVWWLRRRPPHERLFRVPPRCARCVCRCTPVLIALTCVHAVVSYCRHVHVVTNSHSWEASEPTLLPLVCILWKVRWVDVAAAVAVHRFQLTVWYCAPAPAACTHSVATTGPNG